MCTSRCSMSLPVYRSASVLQQAAHPLGANIRCHDSRWSSRGRFATIVSCFSLRSYRVFLYFVTDGSDARWSEWAEAVSGPGSWLWQSTRREERRSRKSQGHALPEHDPGRPLQVVTRYRCQHIARNDRCLRCPRDVPQVEECSLDVTYEKEHTCSQDRRTHRRRVALENRPHRFVTLHVVSAFADSIPMRFAAPVRGRMGTFQTIDGLAVLIYVAVSVLATVKSYDERTRPAEQACMRLSGRTIPADASRPPQATRAGRRCGWHAIHGASPLLPDPPALPQARRRRDEASVVGSAGRTRGDVVGSHTRVLSIPTHPWLCTRGGAGHSRPEASIILRGGCMDGSLEAYCPTESGLVSLRRWMLPASDSPGPWPCRLSRRPAALAPYPGVFVTRHLGAHLLQIPHLQAILSLLSTAQGAGRPRLAPGGVLSEKTVPGACVIVLRRHAALQQGRL